MTTESSKKLSQREILFSHEVEKVIGAHKKLTGLDNSRLLSYNAITFLEKDGWLRR